MPRYSDTWVIERTVFDYVQGGSCACCSFNFLPDGTKGLIASMSEFETDAVKAEVSALDRLPWPSDMKDQVWMDRVRLRQFCKSRMKVYANFWAEHGDGYESWFLSLPTEKLRKWFQLPRTEIVARLEQHGHHMHAALGTVLCAVTEQVAHFPMTSYPADGRGEAELAFEDRLMFDRRGGFTLKNLDTVSTREKWLLRHKRLGGPKLLERNERKDADEEGDADEADAAIVSGVPSFRSDRRIARLLIASHFADLLQQMYLKENHSEGS